MTEPRTPHGDIYVGDVSHSQLIFGDHNTIQTPEGTKVSILQVGDRPVPRPRVTPLGYRPAARIEIVGRDEELRLASSATPDAPLEFYAADGAGKTALLKFIAQGTAAPPGGVVFEALRRRTFDEIQSKLYAAFWESDVPFLPGPADVGAYLADREALLVLDDCALDRDDLDVLLDSAPRCTVVIASSERTLWSRGTARALTGLDSAAALRLLERELGRPVQRDERRAAERLVARLDGVPQSLVETAALVADRRASLDELVDEPAAVERRIDPAALSPSQRRIVAVLAALGSAALGVEHISVLADVPDAARELQALERRGWVKSASPRYELVRELPEAFARPPPSELARRLLKHLTVWSSKATPLAVAGESEAVEASIELGAAIGSWDEVLVLALAAESKLAVAGSWTSWQHVLTRGLDAARALGDEAAEAHMLHQLGSLSLCLGAEQMAVTQLKKALGIRERLGDDVGAELTRHNLRQIGGGGGENGGGGSDNGGGGGGHPRRPRLGVALAAFGVIAAAVVGVGLASNGSDEPDNTSSTTSGPNTPPAIRIEAPKDASTFAAKRVVRARYTCSSREAVPLQSCDGPVASGAAIDTKTAGKHTFTVTASDKDGNESTKTVHYTVVKASGDTAAPSIAIARPKNNGSVGQGETLLARYDCTDEEGGSGLESCDGPVASGAAIDTKTAGKHTFTVTASDKDGNESTKTVHYTVVKASGDTAAPSIAIARPKNNGSVGQGETLLARYDCTDEEGGSGLESCDGPVASGAAIDTKTAGKHTFTVTASDKDGNESTKTVHYTVVKASGDTAAPSIAIARPKNNGSVGQGETVLARYDCTDEEGGSGLESCDGPVASGAAIDTKTAGKHTFTVTASDKDGNESTKTVNYTVTV